MTTRQPESWQPIADTLGFPNEVEMLKHLYISQGFSLSQMSNILGFSTFSVRRRLVLNGIPLRSKGGPNNRIGRRRLKHLSDEDLRQTSASLIAERHQVHISTVYAELRFRAKEKRNALLSDYASESFRAVQE